MERLDRRLAEATAALARLDELVVKSERTLVERDSAVLRLIYSYEAVWKACQKVLSALENVSAASPNASIRAARALGWLSDARLRVLEHCILSVNLVLRLEIVHVGGGPVAMQRRSDVVVFHLDLPS
jgi:hypothetical protein